MPSRAAHQTVFGDWGLHIPMPRPPQIYPCFADPQAWREDTDRVWLDSDEWQSIRRKLLQRFDYTCQYCKWRARSWMIVHHINGNPSDHRPKNLTLVCPMCNLIVHSGMGVAVRGVVDLYRISKYSQADVIRRTRELRARGRKDHDILRALGLREKVHFEQNREYLRSLTAFVTSRKPNDERDAAALDYVIHEEQKKLGIYKPPILKRMSILAGPPLSPEGALSASFSFLKGISNGAERKLWEFGLTNWQRVEQAAEKFPLSKKKHLALLKGIQQARSQLETARLEVSRSAFANAEAWRAYATFRSRCAFLDIETTGLPPIGKITLVGIYDSESVQFFVQGNNLKNLPDAMCKYPFIVTFNGKGFDLPMLRRHFGMDFPQLHWDLRWSFKRLGIGGGLKHIEKRLRLARRGPISEIEGADAPLLWREYKQGDKPALQILKRYCAEDVSVLLPLADRAYNKLSAQLPIKVPMIEISPRPKIDINYSVRALRRLIDSFEAEKWDQF
jgi:uncharacterized protein